MTPAQPVTYEPNSLVQMDARAAIKHERAYWAMLATHMGLSLMVTLLIFGAFALIPLLEEIAKGSTGGRWLSSVSFDVSVSSGLAAMAILATAIVALQVSVRTGYSAQSFAHSLGRQLALETIARLTGIAAFGIALGMSVPSSWNLVDFNIPTSLGPLAGAILLAAIAADGALASKLDHGSSLDDSRVQDSDARRESTRLRRLVASSRLTGVQSFAQALGAFVGLPMSASALIIISVGGPWGSSYLLMATFAAMLIFVLAVLLFLARICRNRDQLLLWAYFYIIAIAVLGTTSVALVSLTQTARPWSHLQDAASSIAAIAFFVAGTSTAAFCLTHRIPGTKIRGIGHQLLMISLEWFDARQSEVRAGRPTASALMAMSIFIAPVGALRSGRLLARHREKGSDPDPILARRASMALGGSGIAFLCGAIGCAVLLFVNPALH